MQAPKLRRKNNAVASSAPRRKRTDNAVASLAPTAATSDEDFLDVFCAIYSIGASSNTSSYSAALTAAAEGQVAAQPHTNIRPSLPNKNKLICCLSLVVIYIFCSLLPSIWPLRSAHSLYPKHCLPMSTALWRQYFMESCICRFLRQA